MCNALCLRVCCGQCQALPFKRQSDNYLKGKYLQGDCRDANQYGFAVFSTFFFTVELVKIRFFNKIRFCSQGLEVSRAE